VAQGRDTATRRSSGISGTWNSARINNYSLDTNDNFEFEQVVVLKKRKEK
jgi:hypothetical protein